MRDITPNARRRKASRAFLLRVGVLLTLITGIAYASWLAPWARRGHTLTIETIQSPAAAR